MWIWFDLVWKTQWIREKCPFIVCILESNAYTRLVLFATPKNNYKHGTVGCRFWMRVRPNAPYSFHLGVETLILNQQNTSFISQTHFQKGLAHKTHMNVNFTLHSFTPISIEWVEYTIVSVSIFRIVFSPVATEMVCATSSSTLLNLHRT